MTTGVLLANVSAWWMQSLVVIASGIVASSLLRWKHPQSRLRFFQMLLAGVVLLPLLQPWRPLIRVARAAGTGQAAAPAMAVPLPMEEQGLDAAMMLLAGAVMVAAARIVWLGVGLLRLRRWRTKGEELAVEGLVGARVRLVEGIRAPATFGWLSPVILLPRALDETHRQAAMRHELIHVARGDWAESMVEQIAAAVCWFQPATWWLMDRIQLAREQAVDAEAAGDGVEREQYLDTLLASAGLAHLPALPAMPFAGKRHLVERVALLTAGRTGRSGWVLRAAVTAAGVLAAGITAVDRLPMRAMAQTADGPMASMRLSQEGPVNGIVILELTLDAARNLQDVRVISGPDELRPLALEAVRGGKFSGPFRRLNVTIVYHTGVRGAVPPPPAPPPPPPVEQCELQSVDYAGLSPDLMNRVQPVMSRLRTGQRMTEAEIAGIRSALQSIDSSLELRTRMFTTGRSSSGSGMSLSVAAGGDRTIAVSTAGGAGSPAPRLLSVVQPEHPPLAVQARIQGTVRFEVQVDGKGQVSGMRLISGHPLLVGAAQAAVAQYRFDPTGEPGVAPVSVEMKLPQ